jgi:hypothetical protein
MHILCWGLPIFLVALSTTCTVYGYSTFDQYTFEVCIFKKETDAVIYHGIFYYGLLIICGILMVYMKWSLDKLGATSLSPSYQIASTSLSLYPPALFICWFPHCILFLIGIAVKERYGFYFASDVLKLAHGFVTAILFFYKSPEARRLWLKLLYSYIGKKGMMKNSSSLEDVSRLSDMDFDPDYMEKNIIRPESANFEKQSSSSSPEAAAATTSSLHAIELADYS